MLCSWALVFYSPVSEPAFQASLCQRWQHAFLIASPSHSLWLLSSSIWHNEVVMHDSLESRIGGVWARCVATKWAHSAQAGSLTDALLVGRCSGLPDVPTLTRTISFKPQEAAGLPSLSARPRHLVRCSGFQIRVDLSCCTLLLRSLFADV